MPLFPDSDHVLTLGGANFLCMFRSKRSRDGHQYNQYIEKWDIGGVNNAVNMI